ncbi:RNA-binding S4 domain-containing protein [Kushneria phosphatilytica]|uniref:Heat shock protein 15 n=1 Tax=Kushneria phosphatilytica TaxID=657387 RepID=A0A1S1NUL6_9GAMM|nr:S4 domain-containing protein [Kushneria phosphatilytica]OHV09715.1 RNA-binding protein [Kushneria phosphatilytica]QEL11761.1 RNA-binding protein [Kushneria phosphatilytica]
MSDQIRLDKWLWAARFFKTRGLAQKAIEGGKVHYNGGRVKPSKAVEVGARLDIPQGWARMEIEVLGVTDKRRSAPEARTLYHETEASAERRQQEAENRRLNNQIMQPPKRRPDRRDRRDIQRFQRQMSDD